MTESHGQGYASTETDGVRAICARHGDRPDALLEILIDVQSRHRCVADAHVTTIADALNLSRAEVHGVRSFYSDFSRERKGRRVIRLCRAEACQAMGADALAAAVQARLGLASGESAADGSCSLEAVYCLGNCALGPAAMVGRQLIGRADAERIAAACTHTAEETHD